MAERLMKYYAVVEKEGGFSAKVKLATMTKLPSTRAAVAPDSPENIDAFRKAYEAILGKAAPSL
jgi:hypothetical protein